MDRSKNANCFLCSISGLEALEEVQRLTEIIRHARHSQSQISFWRLGELISKDVTVPSDYIEMRPCRNVETSGADQDVAFMYFSVLGLDAFWNDTFDASCDNVDIVFAQALKISDTWRNCIEG